MTRLRPIPHAPSLRSLLVTALLCSTSPLLHASDQDNDGIPDSVDNCTTLANHLQTDIDGDGFGNACDADFTDDNVINLEDLPSIEANFFKRDVGSDLTDDARLNFADLSRFKYLLNTAPSPSTAPSGIAAGFQTLSSAEWDEAAVRHVLHTFAYGGQTKEEQITAWANLPPQQAIVSMLSFAESNLALSPPAETDTGDLWAKGGTLKALGDFWSSDAADNDVPASKRNLYNTQPDATVRPDRLFQRAVASRGLNPLRQKIGLWETNYHMSTNLDTDVTDDQMLRYYDDIMQSLGKFWQPYQNTLTVAATSAAVADQYGHDNNVYENGECLCNEDFAREYHQLFFGILGTDDPQYHEETSIKNTARALTDMKIASFGNGQGPSNVVTFGTAKHWPGTLEILHASIDGTNALERIQALSEVAIEHPESLQSLPEIIVRGLADNNLGSSDLAEIRSVWQQMPEKNLLYFLRGYAISKQFHDPSRIRYLNSFDRHMLINTQLIISNTDIEHYSLKQHLSENVKLFHPKHNVFGGQTGPEAAGSSDIFREQYNLVTYENYRFTKNHANNNGSWRKDWAASISPAASDNYRVGKMAELLWNRVIGDGLKNFGALEKAYIAAFLATGRDLAYAVDPTDLNRVFSSNELETDPTLVNLLDGMYQTRMELDSSDANTRQTANRNVGKAIAFIAGTPYIFAEEGS